MTKVKQPMNKTSKILLAVIASILAAVAVSFIILAFIPVKGFDRDEIGDFLYVDIYDDSSSRITTIQNSTAENLSADQKLRADLLKSGLLSTRYTAFRAAFEFSYLGNLRLETETKTDDKVPVWDEDTGLQKKDKNGQYVFETVEEVIYKEYTKAEMMEKTAATAAQYTLEFVYTKQGEKLRTIEVDGIDKKETIEFNAMRVVIYDSENTISEFMMFFFDSNKMNADAPEAVSYRAHAVLVRANTSTLSDNLGKIAEHVKTGKIAE